ncbi:hypothetical protein, partial [Microcoleus sp.]|uniref:hypothetical protein n=1 Tax=Microcoleus sp. TaxID=44472 RepID=UPI003593F1DF
CFFLPQRAQRTQRGGKERFFGLHTKLFFFTAEGAENAERRKREVLLRVFWATGYAVFLPQRAQRTQRGGKERFC